MATSSEIDTHDMNGTREVGHRLHDSVLRKQYALCGGLLSVERSLQSSIGEVWEVEEVELVRGWLEPHIQSAQVSLTRAVRMLTVRLMTYALLIWLVENRSGAACVAVSYAPPVRKGSWPVLSLH